MPLFNRFFVLLWQGQLVSQLGSQAFLIATALFVMEGSGSAALVAGAMLGATVPAVILGPVSGAIADRHSRRSILLVTNLARAAGAGGLALFFLYQPIFTAHHLVMIVATATFNGIMGAIFAPAFLALVPELVPQDQLPAANGFNQMASQTATLAGQALGGVLYGIWGPAVLLMFTGLGFAWAGLAAWFLPRDAVRPRARAPLRLLLWRYATDALAGLTLVRRLEGLTAVLGIFTGVNCLFMPVFVLLPFYTREVLGAGPEWYGFLLSASGAGALAGSLTASVLLGRVAAHGTVVRLCLAGVAAVVIVLGAAASPWLALGVFVVLGILSSVINVTMITAFQSAVEADLRGRLMGLVIALSTAAVPLGMAAGGLLGDVWRESLRAVITGSGLAIAVLAAISWRAGFTRVLERRGMEHSA